MATDSGSRSDYELVWRLRFSLATLARELARGGQTSLTQRYDFEGGCGTTTASSVAANGPGNVGVLDDANANAGSSPRNPAVRDEPGLRRRRHSHAGPR